MVFTESRNSTVIREEDVRGAVATMGFQIPPDIDTTEVISEDDPFRGRVCDAFSYIQSDIPIENSALPILKIVEEAYRDTTNFQVVRTPEKKGGTLIKFESPRGVSAKYFEFDWSKCVRKDDNYDYDEENDIDDAEWLTKEDDLIEQETIQSDDEEEDDDEDDDEDAMENAMRGDDKEWAMEEAMECAWDEATYEAVCNDDYDEKAMGEAMDNARDRMIHETREDKDYDEMAMEEAMRNNASELMTEYAMNKANHKAMRSDDEAEYDDDLWWPSDYRRTHRWVVTTPVSAEAAACGD